MTLPKLGGIGSALYSKGAGDPEFEDELLKGVPPRKPKPLQMKPMYVPGEWNSRLNIYEGGGEEVPPAAVSRPPVVPTGGVPRVRSGGEAEQLSYATTEKTGGLGDIDWGAIMIGATPALMGLLTGDTEAGYGYASKGLLGEAERREKRYLTDRKLAAKEKEKEGLGQLYKYTDPETGEERWGTRKEVHGKKIAAPRRSFEDTAALIEKRGAVQERIGKMFGRGIVADKDTEGYNILVNKATGEKRRVETDFSKISDQMAKRIERAVDGFKKDSKVSIDGLRNAKSLSNKISIGNPIGDALVKYATAKIADGGGRLSDKDVEIVAEGGSYEDKVNQMIHKAKLGTMTPKQKKWFTKIAAVMLKEAQNNINIGIKRTVETRKKGVPTQMMEDVLSVYKASPTQKKEETKGVEIIDGVKYIQMENGKWKVAK